MLPRNAHQGGLQVKITKASSEISLADWSSGNMFTDLTCSLLFSAGCPCSCRTGANNVAGPLAMLVCCLLPACFSLRTHKSFAGRSIVANSLA
jgi:hypothetical protein